MCIYCGTNKYRKIYQNHIGPIPKEPNGRTYEIHHIDGNRNNNDISNLIAVSLKEHYDIHYSQGDWNACLKIASNLDMPIGELSRIATKQNIERVKSGTHPFSRRADGTSIQTDLIAAGKHNFLGEKNPVYKMIAEGKNKLVGGELQRKLNLERLKDGTHPFLDSEKQRKKAINQRLSGNHPFYQKWKCIHCQKEGTGTPSYNRYHGDNCKSRKKSP